MESNTHSAKTQIGELPPAKSTETYDSQHSSESLRALVVRGGFWVFVLRITNRIFGLARTIILARLLAPADFGLFGIALLAMSALETFSQTGFKAALIQKKGDTKSYLDTAWTVQVVRGIILAPTLYVIAPYVATFFDTPMAKSILQVIGVSVLLQGFANTGVIYFQKELQFHKQFVYMSSGTLVDMAVAIPAALLLKSVWALVFGLLAGDLVRTVVSYFIHPYRPRLRFNRQQFRELFGFGKWIFGSTILGFFLMEGDDVFVGKLLGASALGMYQLAYRISNLPATEYSHLISKVTFPAYSKLQDNIPRLGEAYLKVLHLTALLAIPMAGGVFALAPDFTRIFLGHKWMPMAPAMQVLAFYGMLRAIGATTGPIFMAVGKPQISTRIRFCALALLAIIIYPLTAQWGITGTAVAVTVEALVFNLFAVYKVLILVNSQFRKPAYFLILPFINCLVMVSTLVATKAYTGNDIGAAAFFALIAFGVGSYLLLAYIFDIFFDYGSRRLVQEQCTLLVDKSGSH